MDTTFLDTIDEQLDSLRAELDKANTSWERGNLIEEIEDLMAMRQREINKLMRNSPVDVDFHGDFDNMSEDHRDAIIKPHHYAIVPAEDFHKFPRGIEYFDLMDYVLAHHTNVNVGHGIGNAFKYLIRAGKKDAMAQDLRKAIWYLEAALMRVEGKDILQPPELNIPGGIYPNDPPATCTCKECGCELTVNETDFCWKCL